MTDAPAGDNGAEERPGFSDEAHPRAKRLHTKRPHAGRWIRNARGNDLRSGPVALERPGSAAEGSEWFPALMLVLIGLESSFLFVPESFSTSRLRSPSAGGRVRQERPLRSGREVHLSEIRRLFVGEASDEICASSGPDLTFQRGLDGAGDPIEQLAHGPPAGTAVERPPGELAGRLTKAAQWAQEHPAAPKMFSSKDVRFEGCPLRKGRSRKRRSRKRRSRKGMPSAEGRIYWADERRRREDHMPDLRAAAGGRPLSGGRTRTPGLPTATAPLGPETGPLDFGLYLRPGPFLGFGRPRRAELPSRTPRPGPSGRSDRVS